MLIELSRICMTKRSTLQRTQRYDNSYPLSLFLSNITSIKNVLHSNGLLSEIWTRYVDDFFTIVHGDKVEEMLKVANKAHRYLRFIMEIAGEQWSTPIP